MRMVDGVLLALHHHHHSCFTSTHNFGRVQPFILLSFLLNIFHFNECLIFHPLDRIRYVYLVYALLFLCFDNRMLSVINMKSFVKILMIGSTYLDYWHSVHGLYDSYSHGLSYVRTDWFDKVWFGLVWFDSKPQTNKIHQQFCFR